MRVCLIAAGATHELVPNGANIAVTEGNKFEYVTLLAQHRLQPGGTRDATKHFLAGFCSLVPESLLCIFDETELELLLFGVPELPVDEWKRCTVLSGGYAPGSAVIVWFWVMLENFTRAERARLLQFVTGSPRLPTGGFKALDPPMKITTVFNNAADSADGSGGGGGPAATSVLPSARTCFNTLELPQYEDPEQLQEKLLLAINEGGEGFGLR